MKSVASLPLLAIAFMLGFPISPVLATTPDCLYTDSDADGDGWGWENNSSCIAASGSVSVSTPSVAAATATPVQQQASTQPVCSSAAADSDGDGWGWENNTSCIAISGPVSIPAPNVTPTTATPAQQQTTQPVCSSAAADSDGDGWGWENNASCIVTAASQTVATAPQAVTPPATATPVTPQALPAVSGIPQTANPEIINGLYLGRHLICSSASADIDGDGWGFEFHDSCKVIEGYVAPDILASAPPDGNNPGTQVGVIYNQNFNTSANGLYQADQLNNEWQSPFWHLGFDQGRVKIVDTGGTRGNAMQVTYPAGSYGAGGSSSFLSDVQFGMGLPKTYEELYVAYDIRFAVGFDFVRGGKLPGLCGSDVSQAPRTGCNTGGGYPTGYDGWSARGMWRENGELENYIYHASQRNYYGDDEFWNAAATPGVWHRVEHRVVLNTPGLKNGILEAWLDGTKVLSLNNIEYRKTNTIGINLFYFSTFFGGNDISWAPTTDQTMNFDNFVMSTNKID